MRQLLLGLFVVSFLLAPRPHAAEARWGHPPKVVRKNHHLRVLALADAAGTAAPQEEAVKPGGVDVRTPMMAGFLQARGPAGDRLARYLFGTHAGISLEGRPAGRLLPAELSRRVRELASQMNHPPVEADMEPDGHILNAVEGVAIDQGATYDLLRRAKAGEDVTAVRVPLASAWTRKDLLGLTTVLGRFHTWTYGSDGRLHNISLAGRLLDWLVLYPGEAFSFNAAIGPGYDDEGWRKAPIYVYGTSMAGYGGGICQVSTTVYNAAKRAGLSILERHRHGRPVPYVPKGWDATVAYPHFDLRFQNPYTSPVILRVQVTGAKLSAFVLGTPADAQGNTVRGAALGLPAPLPRPGSEGSPQEDGSCG